MVKVLSHLTTKLGTARKVERSRIWIEGTRLVEAGFTVGRYFSKTWGNGSLRLKLVEPDDIVAEMPCKVSGKGAKPIIDITGESVRQAFPNCTHVVCTFFSGGLITVVAADK